MSDGYNTEPPVGLPTAIYLGIVGSSVLLILPVFVGTLASSLNLSISEAGWTGSADLIGYTIGSVLAFRFIDRFAWRHLVLIGLMLMTLGNVISVFLDSFHFLILTRVLSCGLGAGLVIAVPYRSLALMPDPERKTGIYWTFNVLGGALALFVLPRIVATWGSTGLFTTLSVLALSAVVLTIRHIRTPETIASAHVRGGINQPISIAVAFFLAAVAIFNLGLGGVWAFIEQPAADLGLRKETTGTILSATYLVSMAGSSVAAWQGKRLGFLRPYVGAMVVMATALTLLIAPLSIALYIAALALINFCWNYGMTFQFSAIFASDESGRVAVLIILAQSIGLMLGPGIAGSLVDHYAYFASPFLGMVLCLFSALAFFAGSRIHRQKRLFRASSGF